MSEPSLEVQLKHDVHPDLKIDIALTIFDECAILFGPSGAGKSTLLRLIAGLICPDWGRITLHGQTLFDSREKIRLPLRSRGIGLIYQDDLLFPHRNVSENIVFGLKGRNRAEISSRLAEIGDLCGVTHLLDRAPDTLSGGERQRVGLARALAPRPRLLLCDEPVSALDLEGRHALIARLAEVHRVERIPTLYVTHSPTEALTLGSTMLMMHAGKIVDQGKPIDVLGRQTSSAMADWSGARNIFAATVECHEQNESYLRIQGGPRLVVPRTQSTIGSTLVVAVRADDILLALDQIAGLSARNIFAGRVQQIIMHGDEAEVLVETGVATWVVSVVPSAVASLGLNPGVTVHMIIKARSCHVLDAGK